MREPVQEPTDERGRRPFPGQATAAPNDVPAVRTRGLTKSYRQPWTGKIVPGLDDLTLTVERGEVMGYLGPNGAGKTTTLKLLTGLLKPTRGEAWLLGESIDRVASRRRLGFLPEQPYFYEYLTGLEYLELAGQLSGLAGHEAHQRARRWLDRVGLGARPQLILRKYSKGMLQRLGLAAALVHDPELLILDEPMSGLDPFGRRDVRDLILEQRERGKTVLFSSHVLPDVERLCDRVAIVLRGRLVRVATVSELLAEGAGGVSIQCAGRPVVEVPAALAPHVARAERPEGTEFAVEDAERLNDVLAWLVSSNVAVRAVTPHSATLEDLFMATAAADLAEPSASASRRSA